MWASCGDALQREGGWGIVPELTLDIIIFFFNVEANARKRSGQCM